MIDILCVLFGTDNLRTTCTRYLKSLFIAFISCQYKYNHVQQNFNGLNTDGSFTTASSRVPRKKSMIGADIIIFGIIKGDFLLYIDNGMLCVLLRIASMRRF